MKLTKPELENLSLCWTSLEIKQHRRLIYLYEVQMDKLIAPLITFENWQDAIDKEIDSICRK